MYKIFQENKTLIFPKIEGDLLKFDSTLQESDRYDSELLCDFFPEWLNDRDLGETFIHEVGENAVVSALKQTFKMAPAAGGVVVKDGKFVSIVRNGIPDLPKGHIEKGETPENAALREVEEETGIPNLELGQLICVTDHCYRRNDIWHLKHTWWYDMLHTDPVNLTPQREEDITKAAWVPRSGLAPYLKDTYPSIVEVFREMKHFGDDTRIYKVSL